MDLRRADRYPVQLECTASSPDSHAARLSGWTVNASRLGVLVSFRETWALAQVPVIGERVRIVLNLPAEPRSRPCSVDCLCQVVRVHEKADTHLVAFAVQRYCFRPSVQCAAEKLRPGDPGASGLAGPVSF
jgi:hypothetical protein